MEAELFFIPIPGFGHLISAVEMAKLLVDRDDRLSVTVLIIQPQQHMNLSSFINSLYTEASSHRLRFIDLPPPGPEEHETKGILELFEGQKPHVREAVKKHVERPGSPRLAGFIIDMFCTAMIDVASDFGVPSYVFYTCNAAFLGVEFHVQFLQDKNDFDVTELKDSGAELSVPCLAHPYPAKYFPTLLLSKECIKMFLQQARRFRETKGILVNTFTELESYALKSLAEDGNVPPVYPVGPVLKTDGQGEGAAVADKTRSEILSWLDGQPQKSVVFLCFGSMGGFEVDQMREIARALESSGYRFLWTLRRPPPKGSPSLSGEYTDFEEVLPEGFLDRTDGVGKIIGWAPQVDVLAHSSVGGFVSHFGWNSILEGLWFGVPMAAWPLHSEQQLNAFEMVVELGLAVEIKMDYQNDCWAEKASETVSAKEIERGIRCLMDPEYEVRRKVKEMSDKCRAAKMDGGSSFAALGRFLRDMFDNVTR